MRAQESIHHIKMKLRQGQVWQRAEEFIHIIQVERMEVHFKVRKTLTSKEGIHQKMSKKEFCRLLKTAALVPPAELQTFEG